MEGQEKRRSDWEPQPEDARSPYDVDYARIVHSASFRRLQGKTQILNLGDSDFYRTRLTHSLEVAQIAGGVRRQLQKQLPADHPVQPYLPDASLIQAIGFAHDLGHPPFGHGGEIALNYCMREAGGFEGNAQTLRILSKLETFSAQHGADLTRRTLLGVLKYPAPYSKVRNPDIQPSLAQGPTSIRIIDQGKSKPPKCFLDEEMEVVEWIMRPLDCADRDRFQEISYEQRYNTGDKPHSKTKHKSLDCSIMDVADDIAYGVHDLEDAISLKLITDEDFMYFVSQEKCANFLEHLSRKRPDESSSDPYNHFVQQLFSDSHSRKRSIGRLVHYFLMNTSICTDDGFSSPLLKHKAYILGAHCDFLKSLKRLIAEKVIMSPNVQHLEFKGQKMVVSVFEALQSNPKRYLPSDYYIRIEEGTPACRVICDYIAGMTDGFLLKTYDRLFSPRMGSVFDKL